MIPYEILKNPIMDFLSSSGFALAIALVMQALEANMEAVSVQQF